MKCRKLLASTWSVRTTLKAALYRHRSDYFLGAKIELFQFKLL